MLGNNMMKNEFKQSWLLLHGNKTFLSQLSDSVKFIHVLTLASKSFQHDLNLTFFQFFKK